MIFAKRTIVLIVTLILVSCSAKKEPFTELTISPVGEIKDTITITRESSSVGETGTEAFWFNISSQPAISAGVITAVISDQSGATVSVDKMVSSVVPQAGSYTAVGATATVHANPSAVLGFYKLRVAGSNGKQSFEIFRILHVL